jgi:hypothetical protein
MQLNDTQVQDLQNQIPQIFDQYKALIPWLQGVGIGKKVINGITTNEDSIVFFVGQKLDKLQLNTSQVIPSTVYLQTDNTSMNLGTDVVEMPPMSFLQCNDRVERPARGGNCVAPLGAGFHGTLGGIVTNPSGGKHYIVSCAHALAGINQFPTGHPILQNHAGSIIANLTRATPFTTTALMNSDSAIAEVINNADVSRDITNIGVPTGILSRILVGTTVQKSGLATCRQAGNIRYVGVTQTISGYRFRDCFLTDLIGANGDSGSMILDLNRRIVGLLFASADQMTVGCDIKNVISDLEIDGWRWF